MLVLSRRRNEIIRIIVPSAGGTTETIFVHTVDIRGDTARLGFTASNDVRILREEITPKHLKNDNPTPNNTG